MAEELRIPDPQFSWEAGVDSGRTPTIASEAYPIGLKRNALAWLNNATVRGGGITQRTGWQPICKIVDAGFYQGGAMYLQEPFHPYLMVLISGKTYRIRLDTDNSVENITGAFQNPPDVPHAYFQQGEEFMVIQAGDYITKPLFWNGVTLRRSVGISSPSSLLNELPAAGPMDYYMGRLWYAMGKIYTAGDLVGGPSGSLPYKFRDSILKVTENPLAIGGDGFAVPSNAGGIRALKHTANLDTALGQGQLFPFTRKSVYALNVPVTRNNWINASSENQPLQRVAQINFGAYGDRSIVNQNGDLFYQASDGIRSLFQAVRDFTQWGNTPISNNIERALRFNDRGLMSFSSGISFDNRLLETILPRATDSGVVFRAIAPLDFDLISTLQERLPPAWEGIYEGLEIFQLFEADFGGRPRAFAVVLSHDGSIWLWELTLTERFENGDQRVSWSIETPAFVWNDPRKLKELMGCEIWVDKLFGKVQFTLEFRPDQMPCWLFYRRWDECAARDCAEDIDAALLCSTDYPHEPYCEQFRPQMVIGKPPANCIKQSGRQSDWGFMFQFRLTIKGWCRVRGFVPYAIVRMKHPSTGLVC